MSTEVIVAVIVALSSGGGLVAGYRAWIDKKKGAQDATMEGFRSVIGTLREEVDRLKQDRAEDRARIDRVERQIAVERDLKWLSIQHIRSLYAWITQHMPGAAPPPPPDALTEHIAYPIATSPPEEDQP